jgi:hypothetical protein
MDEQEAVSRLVEFAMAAMDRNGVRPPALVEAVEVGSRLADELRRGPSPPPPARPPAPPSSAAAESRVGTEGRWSAVMAAHLSDEPSYRRRTVAPAPTTRTYQTAAVRDVAARRAAYPNWA